MDQLLAVTEMGTKQEAIAQKSLADLVSASTGMGLGEYYKALTEQARGKPSLGETYGFKAALEQLKKKKTPEEVDLLKAKTSQALAAGELSEEKARKIDTLLGEEKEALRTGNELRARQIEEWLDVEISGEKGKMRARDVAAALRGGGEASGLAREKFTAAQQKEMSVIESEIVGSPTGAKAIGHSRRFNERANVPYVYVSGTVRKGWGRDKPGVNKVMLPRVGGKIITARQVSRAAKKANISLEDYLRNVLGMTLEE